MNNNLTLKQSLEILNLILRYKEDSDWDSDGVIYISVSYVKSKYLIKELIGNNIDFKKYVREFLNDGSIDICLLWGDISERFKKDIWYNVKLNKFYVVKWYHRIKSLYSTLSRRLRNWIRKRKEIYRFNKYSRQEKRRIDKRLKYLAKNMKV